MSNQQTSSSNSVEQLPVRTSSTITDELNRVLQIVRTESPADADITFKFDGTLLLHVDVRKLEDIVRLEAQLPKLCGGIFSKVRRGMVDNHPFLHRLTAVVNR